MNVGCHPLTVGRAGEEHCLPQVPGKVLRIPNARQATLAVLLVAASVLGGLCVLWRGAGVTVITHGYDGDVNGWVTAMADRIPLYSTFPGTNFTEYTVTLTTDGSSFFYQWQRTNGGPVTATDSGEVIVKLDWSQMAGGLTAPYDISTADVAGVASYVLLQTNAISDLGGHALVEFPIHLVGHSRGGSLMSEVSHLLGTNGVWVDHLTTLDPHPVNNDGFVDPVFVTDAPVHTYETVLFHDNYWEDINAYPWGEAVDGAYVRPLDNSLMSDPAGYGSNYHSDVHLWYYGTMDWDTPASYNLNGDSATIDATMRSDWWVGYESQGQRAGFLYSRIGGGDRLSTNQPLGSGSAIVAGYNQVWDLGAGVSPNRTSLGSSSGQWPNPIKFDLAATNAVAVGQSVPAALFYQYGGTESQVTCELYLDSDFNPYNSNGLLAAQVNLTNTSVASVYFVNVNLDTSAAPPGTYSVFAKISDGSHARYLYASRPVQILTSLRQPTLEITKLSSSQVRIGVSGVAGQRVVVQGSSDLLVWQPLATNTLSAAFWAITNNVATGAGWQFYRGAVTP